MKLLNAFSINMLPECGSKVTFVPITLENAQFLVCKGVQSSIGHKDTARVFTSVLKHPVPYRRSTVSLLPGEDALVGQYRGPRLEEGATELPQGATIKWFLVTLEDEEEGCLSSW